MLIREKQFSHRGVGWIGSEISIPVIFHSVSESWNSRCSTQFIVDSCVLNNTQNKRHLRGSTFSGIPHCVSVASTSLQIFFLIVYFLMWIISKHLKIVLWNRVYNYSKKKVLVRKISWPFWGEFFFAYRVILIREKGGVFINYIFQSKTKEKEVLIFWYIQKLQQTRKTNQWI